MTDPSPSPTPVGTLLRVSVTAGDRRVDLGVPGNVAAAEIVPGLARTLGVLDAASVYGGYRLVRADGEPVDSARSLLAAGVEERAAATVVAAAGGDGDLARAMWAFAHGMTILELDRRFPPGADLDAAWRRGLDAFRRR